MNLVLSASIFLLSAFLAGCRSTESASKNPTTPLGSKTVIADSAQVQPAERIKNPTTITQNASVVSAVVDSILLLDEYSYRLFATVKSVDAKGNRASIAETGQAVDLRPAYNRSESGAIDVHDEGNARILQLRHAKPGETFHGIISLSSTGGWVISKVIGSSSSK
jgi:hypothetical protein